MLGIHINLKLNFNLYIDKNWESASDQFNALTRFKMYLGKGERNLLAKFYTFKF